MVTIDEEIDLHGLAVDEAMAEVESVINRHRMAKSATVRIIHGKSSGTQNSIKGALHRNLQSRWRNQIQNFRTEPGNPGATLILLGRV